MLKFMQSKIGNVLLQQYLVLFSIFFISEPTISLLTSQEEPGTES